MPFPANQVMNYFRMFISLLTAIDRICLTALCIIASHQEHLRHRFSWLDAVLPAT